jgi:hypothetical protein
MMAVIWRRPAIEVWELLLELQDQVPDPGLPAASQSS